MSDNDFTEVWRDIQGFESSYQVSNLGRVKSLARLVPDVKKNRTLRVHERILRLSDHPQGYLMVQLRKDGRYHPFLVHRLVLDTFVGPQPSGTECCHNNGNKKDNRVENLRWGTREENCKDRLFHGKARKLTLEQVKEIRRLYATGGYTQEQLGALFGVRFTMIGNIVRGETWKV